MKFGKIALVLAAGLLVASTAFAEGGKGEGLYGFQITNGMADQYRDDGDGYITAAGQAPEVGIGFQYWRLMTSDYAFTMNVVYGFGSETDQSSAAGDDHKYTQKSWSVRIGGDRAVKVGDRAFLYFGPGIQYWTGKSKFEGWDATATETEPVKRFGLSGRIGGVMMLSQRAGFNCQVGRFVGRASAEVDGAKAAWFTSGFEGSGGLVFKF
ncbi:MAG: hypothetical protein U0704_10425 [Candidatus Eisenbacteria bacterium]